MIVHTITMHCNGDQTGSVQFVGTWLVLCKQCMCMGTINVPRARRETFQSGVLMKMALADSGDGTMKEKLIGSWQVDMKFDQKEVAAVQWQCSQCDGNQGSSAGNDEW